MRVQLRSLVLTAVAALAAGLVAPAPAQAAVQCGLIVPSKVVINAPTVDAPMTITRGCFENNADHAWWDYVHAGANAAFPVRFTSAQIAQGPEWALPWYDDDPMGRWALIADEAVLGDGTTLLTQNSAVTLVKYGSRLTTSVKRTTTTLAWTGTATQWSGRSHKHVPRPGVTVGLFLQRAGSTTWSYVKSVKTSSTGRLSISVGNTQAGKYRLVVAETPTVWAAYTSPITGRI